MGERTDDEDGESTSTDTVESSSTDTVESTSTTTGPGTSTSTAHTEPSASAADTDAEGDGVPEAVVTEAERLTRLAREAVDDAERAAYRARRDRLVGGHGYAARLREADGTLVLYPEAWLDGDTVDTERIDDTDRAVERALSRTVGEAGFAEIEAHNAALVERVADVHGATHAANVRAFADFMGNHYLGRIDEATPEHLELFREEYYPRNVWPSSEQAAVLEESLERLFAVAEGTYPGDDD